MKFDTQPQVYDISNNEVHSTYDQFLSLRDTLIFSEKKYTGKAWCKLIVWEQEETIEIEWNNRRKMAFEPWREDDIQNKISLETEWPYVEWLAEQTAQDKFMACEIKKDWRYRIIHKEEILPTADTKKVYCYVDLYRMNEQGQYALLIKWGIAVFDRALNVTKTFNTSGTQPNWTCTVSFTLWDLLQKVTSFWYIERDLKEWDRLVLRMKDAEISEDWTNPWNNLKLQQRSNFRSVEYIGLSLKE